MQELSSISLLKRLISEFLKPHRKKLYIAIFAMIIVAICNSLQAWMVKPALDDIFINLNKKMLMLVPLSMILLSIFKAIGGYFQNFFIKSVGQKIVNDIQGKLYEHLIY